MMGSSLIAGCRRHAILARIVALAVVLGGIAAAQERAPAFEVASIKLSPPPTMTPGGGVTMTFGAGPRPGGRWVGTNATLAMLLQSAYGGFSLPGQIVGLPDWGNVTRFEVNAIAAGDPPRDQMNEMVKQLLAERFKLKVHMEPREIAELAQRLPSSDKS